MTSGQWLTELGPPHRTGKLYRNGRPHVTSLRSGYVQCTGNAGRSWLGNNVEQNLANLACAGADRVSLLVLECVDCSIRIQRKDHRFSVHMHNPPLSPIGSRYSTGGLNRRLTAPAIPSKPVP